MNAAEFLKTVEGIERGGEEPTCRSIPTSRTAAAPTGLAINKSNWANTIDTPPFEGYAVTCGVTFTFGGLRINTDGEVLNTDYQPIRGLYAAGELVGGLFYFNYPGGSGLMSGTVFGKIAGTSAGARGKELTMDAKVNAPAQRTVRDRDRGPDRRGRNDLRGRGARLPRAHRRARRRCQSLGEFRSGAGARAGARARSRAARGPLHGVPIGIKDIIDTFDMPTEMGSPIYRGHRPRGRCRLRCAVARAPAR